MGKVETKGSQPIFKPPLFFFVNEYNDSNEHEGHGLDLSFVTKRIIYIYIKGTVRYECTITSFLYLWSRVQTL
jgi:hypothetical protein